MILLTCIRIIKNQLLIIKKDYLNGPVLCQKVKEYLLMVKIDLALVFSQKKQKIKEIIILILKENGYDYKILFEKVVFNFIKIIFDSALF